jgi:uncharacterized protein YegL
MAAPVATLLPFYTLCDVSASMREGQRIETLNDVIVATCDAAAMHPVVSDRVRLGIISFAGRADVVLPLSDLGLLDDLPKLEARDLTSYAPAFRLLRRTIEQDAAQLVADGFRVFRPAVFFLTDGRPTDTAAEWRDALTAVLDQDFPHRPNIIAFGFGDANDAILAEIATVAAYRASDAITAADAIASFGTLLVESVVGSGAAGHLRLPNDPPSGLTTLTEGDLL